MQLFWSCHDIPHPINSIEHPSVIWSFIGSWPFVTDKVAKMKFYRRLHLLTFLLTYSLSYYPSNWRVYEDFWSPPVDRFLKLVRSTFEGAVYATQGSSDLSICQSGKFLNTPGNVLSTFFCFSYAALENLFSYHFL